MSDTFQNHAPGLTAPASHAEAITPSDSVPLARVTRALYVGSGGDVRVRMVSGQIVTFRGVQGGMFYPVRVEQVMATGTTATDLMGMS